MNKSTFVGPRKNLELKISYVILAFLFLSNILISSISELSFDESYYWVFSKFPSFGYFDHPPMVAWSISIGTFLFGHNEFAVRFMSQIYLLGTFFILTKIIGRKPTDFQFITLFISMPLIVTSGLVALPDTPLLFFSTLFFWKIKDYIKEDSFKNTVVLAVVIAAMFYSKYHGLLIVILSVLGNISFLKRKSFWLIIFLVTILFLPHMYWQYQHDFISFKFHLFGRVEKHFSIQNILNYVGSQFFLMGFLFSPLFIYVLGKEKFKSPYQRIMLFNSVGFLIFLFFMSFRNQIEANWTISCSVAFVILMVDHMQKYEKYFKVVVTINILIFIMIRIILFNPSFYINEEEDNRLNEIWGWKDRISRIQDICSADILVGDNYQISSKIAFYLDKPNTPSLHYGSRESHYSILKLQQFISETDSICYLTSKNIMGATKVKSGYKDPVYVVKGTSLKKLREFYGDSK